MARVFISGILSTVSLIHFAQQNGSWRLTRRRCRVFLDIIVYPSSYSHFLAFLPSSICFPPSRPLANAPFCSLPFLSLHLSYSLPLHPFILNALFVRFPLHSNPYFHTQLFLFSSHSFFYHYLAFLFLPFPASYLSSPVIPIPPYPTQPLFPLLFPPTSLMAYSIPYSFISFPLSFLSYSLYSVVLLQPDSP